METLNIRHFKLVNGDEIIGLVAVKNDDSFLVERPFSVSNNILGGFQLSPWFALSENKTYKIMKDHIVNHVMVADDVKGVYVDYALKISERRIPIKTPRSNHEIMDELEEKLIERYEEERQFLDYEEDIEKKIIH
tara:strand:+ start:3526 stop:3930 length:405 start_codon:yes stop_codon:yes gene_type:complete